jgi:hypothetical protein
MVKGEAIFSFGSGALTTITSGSDAAAGVAAGAGIGVGEVAVVVLCVLVPVVGALVSIGAKTMIAPTRMIITSTKSSIVRVLIPPVYS